MLYPVIGHHQGKRGKNYLSGSAVLAVKLYPLNAKLTKTYNNHRTDAIVRFPPAKASGKMYMLCE